MMIESLHQKEVPCFVFLLAKSFASLVSCRCIIWVVEAIAGKRLAKTRETHCLVLRNDMHSFSPQYWKECLKLEDCLHGLFKV